MRWQRMVGVVNMGKSKSAEGTATVNVVFPKALIREMDEYAVTFMREHPDMVMRRSDVIRIAVKRLMRAEEKQNGKGAGR